jgi:hypothetical protein
MDMAIPRLRAAAGWDHSEWDQRYAMHASAQKVHVDVQFTALKPPPR